MAGQCFLLVTAPVSAHEMITLSLIAIAFLLELGRDVRGDLAEQSQQGLLVLLVERLDAAAQKIPRRDVDLARDLLAALGKLDAPDAPILWALLARDQVGLDHAVDDPGDGRVLRGDAARQLGERQLADLVQ